LRVSLAINGTASLLFPLAAVFAHQLVLPNGDEVMKRYLGRSAVSREAGDLARQAGTASSSATTAIFWPTCSTR
jgi:hypothetical protein